MGFGRARARSARSAREAHATLTAPDVPTTSARHIAHVGAASAFMVIALLAGTLVLALRRRPQRTALAGSTRCGERAGDKDPSVCARVRYWNGRVALSGAEPALKREVEKDVWGPRMEPGLREQDLRDLQHSERMQQAEADGSCTGAMPSTPSRQSDSAGSSCVSSAWDGDERAAERQRALHGSEPPRRPLADIRGSDAARAPPLVAKLGGAQRNASNGSVSTLGSTDAAASGSPALATGRSIGRRLFIRQARRISADFA